MLKLMVRANHLTLRPADAAMVAGRRGSPPSRSNTSVPKHGIHTSAAIMTFLRSPLRWL